MSSIEASEAPLLATPEVESAAADAAAAGILGADDSLLGPALEGEALEEEIRRQVEYYLSRDYLSTDPYLVSQMNSDMYFPITTVATLTTFKVDLEVLVKTLRKSTQLVVNENGTMVKPNFKIQRNTLILRDIPSSTKVEEVQSIFQGDNCPATTGIRPDIGDCWFVTFNSEEDALKALDFVRGRTFRDAPVKARIKSENLLRSFTYHAPAQPADLGMKVNAGQYAGYPYYPQYGQHAQAEHHDQRRTRGGGRQPGSSSGPRKEYRNNTSNTTSNTRYSNGSHPVAPGGSPALATPGVTSPPAPHAHTRGSPQQQPAADGERKPRRQPGTRTNTRKQEGSAPSTTTTATNNSANPSSPKEQQPLQFSNVHFPPLSSQSQSQPKHTGYTKDFTKFTKRQLIDIVTSTPVPTKQPASFPSDCLATLSEPNAQVVVSPESNLDRFQPAQEESITKPEAAEPKPAPSTSTAPTPAQPTLASLVATHKSLPTPAPLPAPKRPQGKAKPGAQQPKREGGAAKDSKPQGHANTNAQGKRTPSPPNARKGAAPQQRKRPEETPASQTQQPTAATSTSTTTTSTTPSASPAVAASPVAAPVAAAAAASPATAPAAAPSPTPASGPSTPTYAQLAAKAASKQPPAPQQKKEAEKKSEEAAPQTAPPAQPSSSNSSSSSKKEEKDSGGSKKEEKESASA